MFKYSNAREKMVDEQLVLRGISDSRVLAAMGKVPRDRFVGKDQKHLAFADRPLPIGYGQTISQPYIVALMTEALELEPENKVLEIGTGSGYQTAILAEIVKKVYTIEKIEPLLNQAKKILEDLGYDNIVSKVHDGTQGWPEHAPFDAILVTAGAPRVPSPLMDQLAEGGRMIIPVGDQTLQELTKVTKKNGQSKKEKLGGCRFVPLVGEHGW
jgi:protein-L-isoaspartate(D-aspartate) O-methyltransferase